MDQDKRGDPNSDPAVTVTPNVVVHEPTVPNAEECTSDISVVPKKRKKMEEDDMERPTKRGRPEKYSLDDRKEMVVCTIQFGASKPNKKTS